MAALTTFRSCPGGAVWGVLPGSFFAASLAARKLPLAPVSLAGENDGRATGTPRAFRASTALPHGEVGALILCHTRELAYQIKNEYDRFSKYFPEVKTAVHPEALG